MDSLDLSTYIDNNTLQFIKRTIFTTMKYKFSADTTTYTSKPNKNEAARISNQLEPVFVNSIEDFIDCIQRGSS